jgi:hypothetical protein
VATPTVATATTATSWSPLAANVAGGGVFAGGHVHRPAKRGQHDEVNVVAPPLIPLDVICACVRAGDVSMTTEMMATRSAASLVFVLRPLLSSSRRFVVDRRAS